MSNPRDEIPHDFLATPDNPAPEGGTVLSVATADGLVLRAARWLPHGRARGTVAILQGRAEFIEKYFEVVGELLARGFAVAAFDWRGQGGSGREVDDPRKGHIRDFADYRRDLDAIAEGLLASLPRPHFALAHSMGGAIALGAAGEGELPFERLVAVAPMIAISLVRRGRLASGSARLLRILGQGSRFVPGGRPGSISLLSYAGNRLTTDPVRYARNAASALAVGPGAVGSPTVAWIDAAYAYMARLGDPRFPLKVRLPTLVVAAGADPVCATPAIERFAARLKAGHAIVLPGARHEILMERDEIRREFWAAFDAFIPGSSTARGRPSPLEEVEDLGVEAAVAGGDD